MPSSVLVLTCSHPEHSIALVHTIGSLCRQTRTTTLSGQDHRVVPHVTRSAHLSKCTCAIFTFAFVGAGGCAGAGRGFGAAFVSCLTLSASRTIGFATACAAGRDTAGVDSGLLLLLALGCSVAAEALVLALSRLARSWLSVFWQLARYSYTIARPRRLNEPLLSLARASSTASRRRSRFLRFTGCFTFSTCSTTAKTFAENDRTTSKLKAGDESEAASASSCSSVSSKSSFVNCSRNVRTPRVHLASSVRASLVESVDAGGGGAAAGAVGVDGVGSLPVRSCLALEALDATLASDSLRFFFACRSAPCCSCFSVMLRSVARSSRSDSL